MTRDEREVRKLRLGGGRARDLITLRAPVPSSNSNLFSYTCVANDSRVNCLWQGWLLSLCIIWTPCRPVTYKIRCLSFNYCTWKSDISDASELIEAQCVVRGKKRKLKLPILCHSQAARPTKWVLSSNTKNIQ